MSPPKLHDYQEIARDHLLRNPKGALFLDMGMGKTATVLSSLTEDHLPALAVGTKRVAENVWHTEAKKWRPDLSWARATGTPAARKRALDSDVDLTIIGRDNLADATHTRYGGKWRTIILDELTGYKSRSSKRWKAARKLTGGAPYAWGLTGSPTPQGLLDLWAQMYLLDGGARLGRTLTEYRSKHFTPGPRLPNGIITRWDLRPGHDEIIHQLISGICISMAAPASEEPTFNEVSVPLPPSVMSQYKTLKEDLVLNLEMLGGEVHTAGNAALLSNKLSQVAAGFIYSDEGHGGFDIMHRDKVRAVEEIVAETGSPVLVFYKYAAELTLLSDALGELAHTMDEPDIVERWNAGQVPVLLAHPASAGHGLNLQYGGHTAIWTTLPWSLEEWEQANARLARQGQTHQVVIHLLLSPKTLDPAIQAALRNKAAVQDALLEYLESPL